MERQHIQQSAIEKNGKQSQLSLPVYVANYEENTKAEEWNLRQFLAAVRRRALVVGSVAVIVCAGSWIWTLTRQAQYEGRFALLVEPVTNESKLSGLSDLPGTNANMQQNGLDYETQILVLRSPEMLTPIIKNIAVRYPDINYVSLIENLKISQFEETKILEVSYKDADPQKIQFILDQLSKGFLKYSLQERQTNLRQGIQFVNTQLPQLQGRVNSLQLQLQRFREQYNLVSPDDRSGQLYQKYATLELQRLDIQKELAEAQKFYATLQSKSGAQLALQAEASTLNDSGQTQSGQPQVGAYQNPSSAVDVRQHQGTTDPEQASTQDEIEQKQSSANRVQTPVSGQTLQRRSGAPEAQNEAPIYQNLVSQLRDLETQIAINSTVYHKDSPTVQALKQKRESLLPVLRQEAARALGNKLVAVSNQISLLEVRADKNSQALSKLNQEIQKLPNLARRYTDLQRQLAIATQSLERFLERRELLQIENAQKEVPWQLIAAPQLPSIPIFPNVPRFLLLGAIASILAGVGAAYLLEKLDNGFHSAEDFQEATKLPLLGIVPFHKNLNVTEAEGQTEPRNRDRESRRNRASEGYSYFPFLEAFRSLYTNIGFLSSDTPIHSFVISSSIHAEGKSTVATYLAQAAAAMGRRVLLVDADLRLPQIHHILKLPNETGLSNAISTNVPVADLIHRSPAWENLFILTAGPIPPDPTKLLSSQKMRSIMERLQQQFDLVIYDTPPLLGLADASLIASNTAGIVTVVRVGKTDRNTLTQALDQLKISRAPILGAVCNGVKNYKAKTSYYYYYSQSQAQEPG